MAVGVPALSRSTRRNCDWSATAGSAFLAAGLSSARDGSTFRRKSEADDATQNNGSHQRRRFIDRSFRKQRTSNLKTTNLLSIRLGRPASHAAAETAEKPRFSTCIP